MDMYTDQRAAFWKCIVAFMGICREPKNTDLHCVTFNKDVGRDYPIYLPLTSYIFYYVYVYMWQIIPAFCSLA